MRHRRALYLKSYKTAYTVSSGCYSPDRQGGVKSPPPQKKTCPNQLKSPSQHNTTVWDLDSPHLPLHNNYLLTYDSYVPLYNRFHRGEWITRVSGGEGALDTPGPLNGTGDPGSIPGGGKLNAWDTVPF